MKKVRFSKKIYMEYTHSKNEYDRAYLSNYYKCEVVNKNGVCGKDTMYPKKFCKKHISREYNICMHVNNNGKLCGKKCIMYECESHLKIKRQLK